MKTGINEKNKYNFILPTSKVFQIDELFPCTIESMIRKITTRKKNNIEKI